MKIGFTSSRTAHTVSPRSCTLVCPKQLGAHVCGTRTCGTCARSRVCARHDLRTCKNEMKRQKFMLITFLSSYVAPMYLYVANVFVYNLYITIFGRV